MGKYVERKIFRKMQIECKTALQGEINVAVSMTKSKCNILAFIKNFWDGYLQTLRVRFKRTALFLNDFCPDFFGIFCPIFLNIILVFFHMVAPRVIASEEISILIVTTVKIHALE